MERKILIICFVRTYFSQIHCIHDRDIEALSSDERFVYAMICIQNGDIFMFDETSYLYVKQRLNAAVIIRSIPYTDKYL